ncbi:winged helix-turn-helix domain-containing tetratricopeptide repeat protein [Roseovarius sp. Pro17]|uniref:winged helix-turn-helix domain-containing tetratricopeptide repeat protein n=1 Tax=Roseovarius sp. Pro17 TaxID=3108175 RepID=UPI002D79116D|nr:tetratricopeptide repeat protein [Roseovarius sp. Pro17]
MSGEAHEKDTKSLEEFRLGGFTYSLQTNELKDENGNAVHLRSQSTEVLEYLVRRHGELVSKSDLIENVWSDTFVTDDSLVQCIADIRRALNDTEHRIVQTLTKKGYKLEAIPVSDDTLDSSGNSGPISFRITSKFGSSWFLVLIVLAFVTGVSIFTWWNTATDFEPIDSATLNFPLPEKPSIAVLAFDDLSQGADKGYLSDAISEEIIARLSHFPDFFVIARSSSFFYRDKALAVRDVATELGVRYILEGSQQKAGDRLRVAAQLIDATDGNTIWAATYDRDLVDVFDVQEEITRTIAATLERNITLAEYDRLLRQPTESLAAYELVNRGRSARKKFTPEGNQEAKLLSEKALELDPGYSEAYFSLAWVHINCFRWEWCGDQPHEGALDRAFMAARKAVQLDPDSSLAYWTLANATMQSGDLEQALIEYDRSIALNPNSAGVLADSTEVLVYLGQMDEAIARIQAAIRLNPHHPDWYLWTLAWAQYFAGEYEAGLASIQKMANMPNLARRTQAALYVRLDRMDEAWATIDELLENAPDYTIASQEHSLRGKFRDPGAADRFYDDLRKAGLPD